MADTPFEQVEIWGASEQDLDKVHRRHAESDGQSGRLTLVEANGPPANLSEGEDVEFASVEAAIATCQVGFLRRVMARLSWRV